ncbi:site-specific integrase [Sellimonas caecigallum]|uniref:Site-specific integrase n=1 Tax=Sellimonas caecigallum TaxID=2592333 RepID=A0ABS7L680_9FIRM|nr:site-specific integrase [Sellimonas caecigallum]MBY0758561.1 site-specific integrase [Sellimonas caecigallum]
MPTARKLPSGSWRCQVYSHTEEILKPDGSTKKKRVYESFTCDISGPKGKRIAEQMAAEFAARKEEKRGYKDDLTFGEATDQYIQNREAVLSPRTIMDYKRIRKNDLKILEGINLNKITQEDIQRAINLESKKHSPKTVRNTHGLISAVLRQYRPDFALNTSMPKKIRPDIYIPSDGDIKRLIKYVEGTEMELPILLAAFGPMRRGEICALDTKNIDGNVVHVCCNMVCNEAGEWIIRVPKSYAGDRYIDYPEFVSEKWKGKKGKITTMTPDIITTRFARILKRADLPHFRFHDLRHYSASIQHALGIPDSYIMARGGWGNDGVLKNVYRHVMSDPEKRMNQIANQHFSELCNTNCNTK